MPRPRRKTLVREPDRRLFPQRFWISSFATDRLVLRLDRRPSLQESLDPNERCVASSRSSGVSARRDEARRDDHSPKPDERKDVLTDDGPVAIEVPRDRQGTFEPRLI